MIKKGIVERDCFKVLLNQGPNQAIDEGVLSIGDIWNFLVQFNLATEIKEPESLYIPALIPDENETSLRQRLSRISKSEAARGFYYSFDKCDETFGLFSKLLCQLASKKHFYMVKDPGIMFDKGFSVKIENRQLGIVAAMAGCLKWFDQSQEEADEIEFIVAERDWNHYDPDRRFGRHKVDLPSNSILKVKIQTLSHSGHMCLPETRRWLQGKLSLQSHQVL